MYASEVDGSRLTFQVSGMLWQRSLVMRDLETKTLWSHLLGRGMQGKLRGVQLSLLPGVMTTWREWRTRHPGTTVLAMSRTAGKFNAQVWKEPGLYVYGVPMPRGIPSPAVAMTKLSKVRVFSFATGDDERVLVTLGGVGNRIQAFDPLLDDGFLTFFHAGGNLMRDRETGSTWDLVTGVCLEGELAGKALTLRPGTISYEKAWRAFHPKGTVWR